MDTVMAVPGPSQIPSRAKNRARRTKNAIEEKTIDSGARASSSKTVPRQEKKEKKEKKRERREKEQAEKLEQQVKESAVNSDLGTKKKIKEKSAKQQRHERRIQQQQQQSAQDRPTDQWDCVPIAQNQVSRIPPIWSNDGRFYFTVSHTSIHIHSSTPPSFTRLSTLSSTTRDGHRKPITSLCLHPANPMQIITAAEDGLVKVWDWVEGRLVRTLTMSETGRVLHLCIGQVGGKWFIFATAANPKDTKHHYREGHMPMRYRLLRIPLTPTLAGPESSRPHQIGKLSSAPSALILSPRSTYLVALVANKAYTYRLLTDTTGDTWQPDCVKFVSDQQFTCGAFSPDRHIGSNPEEEWFATGDVKGVIRLWHGLSAAFTQLNVAATSSSSGVSDPSKALFPEMEKRLPTTSLHWHAHAVSAIAFTPSGAQLLSVGEESVLVQWHLGSGKREYVPRLGGRAIVSLAVKSGSRGVEEEWWMRLADGGVVRVGSASGQVTNVGQGVRLDPLRPISDTAPYPLTIHPTTRSLVLPSSHPSTLQFIDAQSSSVLFDLEVAPSNRVSRRDEKELEPVAVEHVAFDSATAGGNRWMVTVEGRKGDEVEGGGMVKNLKMWKWHGDSQKYMINTQYPRPHGNADIVKTVFSSSTDTSGSNATHAHPYLLTTSRDGVAKLWQVRQAKRADQGKGAGKKPPAIELFWSTRSTFSYRSLPIYDAAFSPDSTILALTHGSIVTLWDVESNALLKALDGTASDACQVGFVGSDGRYLVSSGKNKGITVWDLMSCEVSWSNPDVACHRLITSSDASFFIALHEPQTGKFETDISIYSTRMSKPLRQITIKAKINRFCLLPSAILSPTSLQFAGITLFGEVYRFGDDIARVPYTRATTVTRNNKQTSIWQEMFGKDAFLELEDSSSSLATTTQVTKGVMERERGSGRPSEVYDGPSHTMPPVNLLFDAFIEEILGGPPKIYPTPGDQEGGKAEIVYDVVSEIQVGEVEREQGSRAVTDQDMVELEDFFKNVLSSSTKPSYTTPTTPKGKRVVNGHEANGHGHATTQRVNGNHDVEMKNMSNGSALKQAMEVQDEVVEEDEDEDVDNVGNEKKRGKKRKTKA